MRSASTAFSAASRRLTTVAASATALRSGSGAASSDDTAVWVGPNAASTGTTRVGEDRRGRQLRVAEIVGEAEVVVRGQLQQLLEAQHGHLLVAALADHHRRLVVARHAGAQHLELRLRAGVETGLRLLQRGAGLIERGPGDRHETVGEQRRRSRPA